MPAEPIDLAFIEMNAMGEPDIRLEPARLLEIIDRPAMKALLAILRLVMGLGDMGMKTAAMAARQEGRLGHQFARHRERRAGSESDLDHGALPPLVIAPDHPLAVGQDGVAVLHDAVGRQTAVALGQVHRSAAHHHAQANGPGLIDLDVDRLFATLRKEIMMIEGRGAARHQELGQSEPGGEAMRIGRQPRPVAIERLEPGEELLVDRLRMGARQRLIHVMMRIDETRQYHVTACIECLSTAFAGLAPEATSSAIFPSSTTRPPPALSARQDKGSRIHRRMRLSPCLAHRFQSSLISPSTTWFKGAVSELSVMRNFSTLPRTPPVRTTFSISRCDVIPTSFRNFLTSRLKLSSSVIVLLPAANHNS
jgi:hypothetical protein